MPPGRRNTEVVAQLGIGIRADTRDIQKDLVQSEQNWKKHGRNVARSQSRAATKVSRDWKQSLNRVNVDLTNLRRQAVRTGAALVAAFTGGTVVAVNFADEVRRGATQLRLSVRDYDSLLAVFERFNLDYTDFIGASANLTEQIFEATQGSVDHLEALRDFLQLEPRELLVLPPDEQFIRVLGALDRIRNNEGQYFAAGARLLGGDIERFGPVIALGEEGLRAARQEAINLNLVLDTDTAQSLGRLRGHFSDLNRTVKVELTETFADFFSQFTDQEIQTGIRTIRDLLSGIGTAIQLIGNGLSDFSSFVSRVKELASSNATLSNYVSALRLAGALPAARLEARQSGVEIPHRVSASRALTGTSLVGDDFPGLGGTAGTGGTPEPNTTVVRAVAEEISSLLYRDINLGRVGGLNIATGLGTTNLDIGNILNQGIAQPGVLEFDPATVQRQRDEALADLMRRAQDQQLGEGILFSIENSLNRLAADFQWTTFRDTLRAGLTQTLLDVFVVNRLNNFVGNQLARIPGFNFQPAGGATTIINASGNTEIQRIVDETLLRRDRARGVGP